MPLAATTALMGIRDAAADQPEQRVLVDGASGGVGTFAVQVAAHPEAEVTGVCSTRNVDLVMRPARTTSWTAPETTSPGLRCARRRRARPGLEPHPYRLPPRPGPAGVQWSGQGKPLTSRALRRFEVNHSHDQSI